MKIKTILIASAAVAILIIAAVILWIIATPNDAPETQKELTEIQVWEQAMQIKCPDTIESQQCRIDYENNVSEVTGRQVDSSFADNLLNQIGILRAYEGEMGVGLKKMIGWSEEDFFDLSVFFSEDFLAAVKSENLGYLFIGTPGDSYAAMKSDTPFIPIAFVNKDGSLIGTFDISYNNIGDTIIPCIQELCDTPIG